MTLSGWCSVVILAHVLTESGVKEREKKYLQGDDDHEDAFLPVPQEGCHVAPSRAHQHNHLRARTQGFRFVFHISATALGTRGTMALLAVRQQCLKP